MVKRNYLITLGIAAALALPAGPALAAGKGHAYGHLKGHHHTRAVHPSTHGKSLRQLEGTVVSLDGSSVVLRPMGSKALMVTVAISSSTVVTAAAGVTPTLAAGEQVHVAGKESNGTYWAVRILIQKNAAASRALGADKAKR
jgi:Domain of unknown function (DUF5666)